MKKIYLLSMKKIGLLLIGLTITIFANGQIVKIQGGPSFSQLDLKLNLIDGGVYRNNETMVSYSVFAGVDYLEKKYFNLSSNIGMIRKRGRGAGARDYGSGWQFGLSNKLSLDYLSMNTTMDFNYPIKKISPFISVGPRFDYLLHSNNLPHAFADHFDAIKKTSFGLILGGGLKYDISKLQFGLRADYNLDFSKKIAEWPDLETGSVCDILVNVFTVNLSIGYRLK